MVSKSDRFINTYNETTIVGEMLRIIGFGNPMVDTVFNHGECFLENRNILKGSYNAIENCNLSLIEDELKLIEKQWKMPGGAALNTIRMAQAFHDQLNTGLCGYVGSVGNDQNAEYLKSMLSTENIECELIQTSIKPTGRCFVLVTDHERTLLTTAYAAYRDFLPSHLEFPRIVQLIDRTPILFTTVFFMDSSFETVLRISELCKKKKILFALGLSDPGLVFQKSKQVLKILEYVDLLFGNREEVDALAHIMEENKVESKTSIASILRFGNPNKTDGRILIVTDGPNPVRVHRYKYSDEIQVNAYPTIAMADNQIVDTNGAGDAFAGGVLYGISLGKSERECISYGIFAAKTIIMRHGFFIDESTKAEIRQYFDTNNKIV